MNLYIFAKKWLVEAGVTIHLETETSLYITNKHGVKDVIAPDYESVMDYLNGVCS